VYISSRKAQVCDKVAQELNRQGPGECFSIPADLQKIEDIKHLVEELSKREKKLHVLVNNAGANWAAPVNEYPDEAFQASFLFEH
jgi:short-subunit dehydrogenase